MAHDHSQQHSNHNHRHDVRVGGPRRLTIVLLLSGSYMVAEAIGGLLTNSLALLADAGHMLSDVAALSLALFALTMAQREPTPRRTYGFYRTEILAALFNGSTLVAISIYIFVEAFQRFRSPPEVRGGAMMAIAFGGLAINLIGLWILRAGKGSSLNERGAWLHVMTDALGSVGAIVGGFAVWQLGWNWADPAVSVAIGLLVAISSWNLLKESVAVLMEGAPGHVDVDVVREAMMATPDVTAVHDLHVWSITSGMTALSAHVCSKNPRSSPALLSALREVLDRRFGIDHTTIQIEPEDHEEGEVHA
jgi:cobalt-zinc-cadmium efflux system protein